MTPFIQAAATAQTLGDAPSAAATKIALVLALSFLVGFEREEHKQTKASWTFGGVRAFPLIGLSSYALALIGGADLSHGSSATPSSAASCCSRTSASWARRTR